MGYIHLATKELSVAVDGDGAWQLCGTAEETVRIGQRIRGDEDVVRKLRRADELAAAGTTSVVARAECDEKGGL
ncbi:hypothetical protein AWC22_05635 [Mycobacterium riyadhense]|uniref:Uncharacterized protein n=1 Tax=Mycobacterium riyadhense TaxID=486698 RepID=A0A1X2BBB4_9MYCO|nr:hypothetical protein AWC22_05635 [Mycobacterium riyadhense]VTP01124.1 hypothetical protein BIN_B_03914 [Mycobacterium riyadhense]